jgi:hypothetical protein
MKQSLLVQEKELREAARARGLKVRKSKTLEKTPYRAMNPPAAKELGIKCPKNVILYDSRSSKTQRRKVMDLRHELIEHDEMKKGKTYRNAHKVANRKQRTIGVV